MSDLLVFSEPGCIDKPEHDASWKILIVDDEPAIHQVTKLALSKLKLENKGVVFLDAYSAAEAKTILLEIPDIAMMFLDVIMETDTAGLDLVHWIRNDLGNKLVRIVLRTGQAGAAPEEKVILEYDINDYKEKTELVRSKLFSTTCASIRNYAELVCIEKSRHYEQRMRQGLEKIVISCAHLFESKSLSEFASGLLLQMASILHLNEDGLLLKTNGLTALKEDKTFTLLAQSGRFLDNKDEIPDDVMEYLQKACENQSSLYEHGRFIGYFPSKQGIINLLYFEGVCDYTEPDKHLVTLFGKNISAALERMVSFQYYKETNARLIHLISDSLDSRSPQQTESGTRLAALCLYLGTEYGLNEAHIDVLVTLAPLHDIGLLGISDELLTKVGPLSDEEWTTIRNHPELGKQILADAKNPVLQMAAEIAFEHHENYDGSGYPRGISGTDISTLGRIVAIADVFNALTQDRNYRQAWSVEQAVLYLLEQKGKQFDPELVELFIKKPEILAQIVNQDQHPAPS